MISRNKSKKTIKEYRLDTSKNNNILSKTLSFFILIFVFIILLAINSFLAFSFPRVPAEFYGAVISDLENGTVGMNVTAYDPDGVLCGHFLILNDGYYGLLSCLADDYQTPYDEGAEKDDEILFFIDGMPTVHFGNNSWDSGTFKEVNLSLLNYPPFFLHDIPHQYVNETETFFYNVNASDLNYWDILTYYDDTDMFDIDPFTGIINFTPIKRHVGNHTITITVCDGELNASITFNLTVFNVDHPPVIEPIGDQIAVEGQLFTLQVIATDADNDTLIFSDDTHLFNIDPYTGLINFTPTFPQIGNHTINISVTDGMFNVSEVFNLEIIRGPYCGDGYCGPGENCLNCPEDCGPCPPIPPGVGEGEGDGVDGPEDRIDDYYDYGDHYDYDYRIDYRDIFEERCDEKWECTEWSECSIDGWQTRTCVDVNNCGTTDKKPEEERECIYEATCDDGIKNCHMILQEDGSWIEVCEEGIDCGGPCPPCPTCDDGIQNCHKIIQEDGSWIEVCEEGIDCGGPCPPCEIKKPAEIPGIIEVDFLIEYPWLLWILIIAIILLTVSEDKAYIKKIMKKEFKQYRKDMLRYIKIRKRIYGLSIFVSCIILIFSLYIFSLQFKKDFTLLYVGGTLVIITGFLLYIYLVKKFKYDEKKKNKEEQIFLETDKRKTENLIKIAEENLLKMELKTGFKIYKILKNGFIGNESEEDESVNEIIKSINNIYRLIRDLVKKRKKTLIPFETDKDTKKLIKKLSNNRLLKSISMKYPEIKEILRCLKKLDRNLSKKETKEKDLVNSINDYISRLTEIAFDKHLIIVIKSDKRIISLYNGLIDIYDNYQKQINEKVEFNKNITDKETDFRRMLEKMTNRGVIIEKIRTTKELKSIYNDFVDLYNNYKRKEDLYNDLKQIELRKREILRS